MGLQKRVEELLAGYTDLPEDLRSPVARDIAIQLGRAGGPAKYEVKASAKKDGVFLGEASTTKLIGSPINRLFAAASQLEQTIAKLVSTKGAYQMHEVQACITVSEGLVKSLRDQYADKANAEAETA